MSCVHKAAMECFLFALTSVLVCIRVVHSLNHSVEPVERIDPSRPGPPRRSSRARSPPAPAPPLPVLSSRARSASGSALLLWRSLGRLPPDLSTRTLLSWRRRATPPCAGSGPPRGSSRARSALAPAAMPPARLILFSGAISTSTMLLIWGSPGRLPPALPTPTLLSWRPRVSPPRARPGLPASQSGLPRRSFRAHSPPNPVVLLFLLRLFYRAGSTLMLLIWGSIYKNCPNFKMAKQNRLKKFEFDW